MEKECCDVKVTELEDGMRIEIRGEGVKDRCKLWLERCGAEGSSCEEFFKRCCVSREEE